MDRKEEAFLEDSDFRLSGLAKWVLFVGFLIPVLSVGVVDNLGHVFGWSDGNEGSEGVPINYRSEETGKSRFSIESVLQVNRGLLEAFDGFEKRVERGSVLERAAKYWRWGMVAAGGTGSERVLRGWEGRLFLEDNIEITLGRLSAQKRQDVLGAVRDLAKRLARENIHLIVVPVPSKVVVEPHWFTRRFGAGETVPLGETVEGILRELGAVENVTVCPVGEWLTRADGDPFLVRDTHWTPVGMEAVAIGLSRLMNEEGIGTAFTDGEENPGAYRQQVQGSGDLVEMLDLPASAQVFPNQRVEAIFDVRKRSGPPGIVLLGDSFSGIYGDASLGWGKRAATFPDLISAMAGVPVLSLVNNGDPILEPRVGLARILAREPGRLDEVEVVIWQFSLRFLAEQGWESFFFLSGEG